MGVGAGDGRARGLRQKLGRVVTEAIDSPPVLDLAERVLLRQGVPYRLTPKAFQLLCFVLRQPDRILTSEEIIQAIWEGRQVGSASLKTLVRQVRAALGDSSAAPRYIETLRGQGYRYLGGLSTINDPTEGTVSNHGGPEHWSEGDWIVGRQEAFLALEESLALSLAGHKQVVVVEGAMGVGKTSLVAKFLAQTGDGEKFLLAKGQAGEQSPGRDAYSLFLDTLDGLTAGPKAALSSKALFRDAPGWLLQMPWLCSEAQRQTLRKRTAGIGAQRLLKEFETICLKVAAKKPLVIWLEDLHVADDESLALFSHLMRRQFSAALCIVATCRKPNANPERMKVLARHKDSICRINLSNLRLEEVGNYLDRRLPRQDRDQAHAKNLHRVTGGNPLFLKTVVDDWMAGGVSFPSRASSFFKEGKAPEALRRLIDDQVTLLVPIERDLLTFAAVLGRSFTAKRAARVLSRRQASIANHLRRLSNQTSFLLSSDVESPGRGLGQRFSLAHDLYRLVLLERLSASGRRRLHLSIAGDLQAEQETTLPHRDAEISRHFRLAGQPIKAFHALQQAVSGALARNLPQEALVLLREGETLLNEIEALDPTLTKELLGDLMGYHLLSGTVYSITLGFGDSKAAEHYQRALQLGHKHQVLPVAAHATYGLWTVNLMRGDLNAGQQQVFELDDMSNRLQDDDLHLLALLSRQSNAIHGGRLAEGQACCAATRNFYDPKRFGHFALRYGVDVGIFGYGSGAWVMALQGRQDEALKLLERGNELADELGYPIVQAIIRTFAAICHYLRGDPQAVIKASQNALAITQEYDFQQWTALTTMTCFWAEALTDDPQSAALRMREGIERWQALGFGLELPRFWVGLATAELAARRPRQAIAASQKALEAAERSGEHWQDAECYRLMALAELRVNRPSKRRLLSHFDRAVRLNQASGAKLWELRCYLDRLAADLGQRDWDLTARPAQELLRILKKGQRADLIPEVRRAEALL